MKTKLLWCCGIVVVVGLLALMFPGAGISQVIIKVVYYYPLPSILLLGGSILLISSADYSWEEFLSPVGWVIGLVLFICSLVMFSLTRPMMLASLYRDTEYQIVQSLPSISSFRDVSYMEAAENMRDSNPDPQFEPGNLDYIKGTWIADYSPKAGVTRLTEKTRGVMLYDASALPKVEVVKGSMPFAEGGWLWNSAMWWVNSKFPFASFTDIIYVENDGEIMGVIPLIYRKGFFPTIPYVKQILLVHGDGNWEALSMEKALRDPRLEGLQLLPEDLAKERTLAYGWRHGIWKGLFTKMGRVQVQESTVNQENSAPYLLEMEGGEYYWYTPVSPLRRDALSGMTVQSSSDPSLPVVLWLVEEPYRGIDALASTVKAVERQQDINWLRVSRVEGKDVRSGDTDIIELIPCPRLENGTTTLYFCGYVAMDPPKVTRFFVIINAKTQEVLQEVRSADEINQWLRGELELSVPSVSVVETEPQEIFDFDCNNPQALQPGEIIECIQFLLEELDMRE